MKVPFTQTLKDYRYRRYRIKEPDADARERIVGYISRMMRNRWSCDIVGDSIIVMLSTSNDIETFKNIIRKTYKKHFEE